jgi:neutral ceramidase
MRRPLFKVLLLGLAAALISCFAYAFSDHCPPLGPSSFHRQVVSGEGSLVAGAAFVPFTLPDNVTVAGYAPPRASATRTEDLLGAKATALRLGAFQFSVVLLDALFVGQPLVAKIRRCAKDPLWVLATHTHSGPGHFDPQLASQIAALGRYRPDVESALVEAACKAIEQAQRAQVPASLRWRQVESDALAVPRSGDAVDGHLHALEFVSTATQKTVARWYVANAHPTLVRRGSGLLSGDYPAVFSGDPDAVTLVIQGAAGNASPKGASPREQAALLTDSLARAASQVLNPTQLTLSTSTIDPGPVDSSRLGFRWLQPAIRNTLCVGLVRSAELSTLQLGPVRLLAVPFEPSAASGQQLKAAAKADVLLSLANGYVGYLEPESTVVARQGESTKQYFDATLLQRVVAGIKTLMD